MIKEKTIQEIDQLIKLWNKPDSPGCALGIIKDGKFICKKGYGMADLEHDIPITPQTKFYIGSNSKQFTAMCILLLVEQNRISLDDDIRKYLPKFPNYDQSITIRNLIHHTSGIRCHKQLFVLAGKITGEELISRQDSINIIYKQKELNFNPGTSFLYSTSNYFLLATIIKNVTGKSVKKFAEKYIFKPLNMKSTHYQDNNKDIINNRAFCYVPDGFQKKIPKEKGFFNYFIYHDGSSSGGGGVFTTIEDYFLWDQNFHANKLGKSDQSLIYTMITPGRLKNEKETGYAFGLMIDKYKDQKRIWHVGGKGGYRAVYFSFPELKLSIIMLCNCSSIDEQSLALQISDIFLENILKTANKNHEKTSTNLETSKVSVDLKILKKYAGVYISEPLGMIRISIENGRLMFQDDGPKMELIPESVTSFFLKAYNMRLNFEKDESGKYSQFALYQQGNNTMIKTTSSEFDDLLQDGRNLIKRTFYGDGKMPKNELKQFEGTYYNEEVDASHKLLTESNTLFIYGGSKYVLKFPLTFWKKDAFLTPFYSLKFQRTENGVIEAYKLDTSQAKNLWFTKIS